jgi:hypothetical protein
MKDTHWKSVACLAAILLAGSLPAALQASQEPVKAADISGVWEMTMQTPRGEMKADVTFVQKDDVLTVTMPNPMGEEMKGEGKVKENTAEWKFAMTTPDGGEFILVFKAQIEGEKMTGEVQMGDFGSSGFTAVKKK